MNCIYDDNTAVGLDLCHGSHPICADHLGHQLADIPAPPKARKKTAKPRRATPAEEKAIAETVEAEAEAADAEASGKPITTDWLHGR
jgi:hypothetical protein